MVKGKKEEMYPAIKRNRVRSFFNWNIAFILQCLKALGMNPEIFRDFKEKEFHDIKYLTLAEATMTVFPVLSSLPIAGLIAVIFPTPFAFLSWPIITLASFYVLCMFQLGEMVKAVEKGWEPNEFSSSDLLHHGIVASVFAIAFIAFVSLGLQYL